MKSRNSCHVLFNLSLIRRNKYWAFIRISDIHLFRSWGNLGKIPRKMVSFFQDGLGNIIQRGIISEVNNQAICPSVFVHKRQSNTTKTQTQSSLKHLLIGFVMTQSKTPESCSTWKQTEEHLLNMVTVQLGHTDTKVLYSQFFM